MRMEVKNMKLKNSTISCFNLLKNLSFATAGVACIGLLTMSGAKASTITNSFTVSGESNPWLAGMPEGSGAGWVDTAPYQSPLEVTGMSINAGDIFNFSASGAVRNGSCPEPGCTTNNPDGGSVIHEWYGGENGISDIFAPLNSLIGVFLGNDQPNFSIAPQNLDFSSVESRNYLNLNPTLKQTFYIGDGLTNSGTFQKIIAPVGATRLFLGTMDGYQWGNNLGFFNVTVTKYTDDTQSVPEPVSTFSLLSLGAIGIGLILKYKQKQNA